MSRDIRARILSGAKGQGFSQAVTIIIQFASVPVFLYYWGVDLYGEWLILSAIPAYLLMSDLGFGVTASREMAMQVSRGQRDVALEVFQSVWVLVTSISFLIGLICLGILSWLPLAEWFNFSVMQKSDVAGVLLILIFQVLLNLQDQLVYAGYNSEGYYGAGTIWLTFIRLAEFIAQMLAVILGFGPLLVAAAGLLFRVLLTLMMRRGLYNIAPWIVYGIRNSHWKEAKRLALPSISAMAFPLGRALNLQGVRIIVGLVLGPATVAAFATLRTLTRFIPMVLTAVNGISQPEISMAFGKNDMKMLRKIHRKTCQLAVWGSVILCALLYFLGGYIYEYWTAGKIEIDRDLFFLMLLAAALQSYWSAVMVVLLATNRHTKIALLFIVTNFLFLVIAYLVLDSYGVFEMMLALIMCEVVMLVVVLPDSLRFTGDLFRDLFLEVIKPPVFLLKFFLNNTLRSKS